MKSESRRVGIAPGELTMPNEHAIVEAHFTPADLAVNDFQNRDWDKAKAVEIDRYWSGELAPEGRRAEACLLWSNKALHVRFACHQTEPLVVSDHPQTEKKTMRLWDRDVCEIFKIGRAS